VLLSFESSMAVPLSRLPLNSWRNLSPSIAPAPINSVLYTSRFPITGSKTNLAETWRVSRRKLSQLD
jgi:hypothetical protein